MTFPVSRRYDRRAHELARARENAAWAARNRVVTSGGGGGGGGATGGGARSNPNAAQSRELALANTFGRADAIQNDPLLNEANSFFQNVMRGGNLPYSNTAVSNMKARAASMNADAEAANARAFSERYAAGGGNINDPASIARRQEAREDRQSANQVAATEIDMGTQLANYNAQLAAAEALGQGRRAQFGIANNPTAQGVSFLSNDSFPNQGGYGGYNSLYDLFLAAMQGGM